MLPRPPILLPAFSAGMLACILFGSIFSIPSIWHKLFPTRKETGTPADAGQELYAKAGEYGESEADRRCCSSWSLFKEPLNAWTSLAYSLFGIVMFLVGGFDYLTLISTEGDKAPNRITEEPGFSMMLGSFCVYLGVSSFLFHASHTETWRKADAGMTSGVMLPLLLFGLWDRARPPATSALALLCICNFLLVSLTYGYMPYGSSDILLPSLIAFVWIIELLPRYGGVVDDEQYIFWLQCVFAVVGGALLRAVDVKRKVTATVSMLVVSYFLVLAIFWLLLGASDYTVLIGLVAGVVVAIYPERGHICWHAFSAYALFIWWYMLRLRPGNPYIGDSNDTDSNVFALLLFLAVKNAVRRCLMNTPRWLLPAEYRDRVRLLFEHTIFAVWGYYSIVIVPTPYHSWLQHPILCWFEPAFPYEPFQLYYTARAASHIEDALYLWVNGATFSKNIFDGDEGSGRAAGAPHAHRSSSDGVMMSALHSNKSGISSDIGEETSFAALGSHSHSHNHSGASESSGGQRVLPVLSTRKERADGEAMRGLHHNISCLLATMSFFCGYAKIGSLVMIMHDVSDVPLDFFVLFSIKGWRYLQLAALSITIPVWIYWRLWLYPTVALYTITFQSKSMLDRHSCEPGDCSWLEAPERAPFLLCLIVILGLNLIWQWRMFTRGYRLLRLTSSSSSSLPFNSSATSSLLGGSSNSNVV